VKKLVTFAEYRVSPQNREQYLKRMASAKSEYPGMTLLESGDAPGLFVEVWRGAAKEALWRDIEPWIEGGREKMKVWRFFEVFDGQ